jgi:hypothetical protein
MKPLIRFNSAAMLLLYLPMAGTLAQSEGNVVQERVTYDGGVVRVCGEGGGLDPCLDANGQTYAQEVRGPSIDSESEDQLMAEAARIRVQSPEQLQQTIGEMEKGYNPDVHATEGLPH